MKRDALVRLMGIAAVGGLVFACAPRSEPTTSAPPPRLVTPPPGSNFTQDELNSILTLSPLPPLPKDPTNRVADDPRAAALGQSLFFDTRLSGNGRVSCASCHEPAKGFADGQHAPEAFSRALRNVPGLWNVAYNRWYFWDGRADSLWAQALGPLEATDEHNGKRLSFAWTIANDPALRRSYESIFGPLPPLPPDAGMPPSGAASARPIFSPAQQSAIDTVFVNIGKAIAAYERKLISRRSPFDVFVEGLRDGSTDKLAALSPSAQRGLKIFVGKGSCLTCHHGPNFTDDEFHDTGVNFMAASPQPDLGRLGGISKLLASPFNTLGDFSDDPAGRRSHPTAFLVNMVEFRGQFKTPSLRNVALTAPYMHRGQLATLEDVVRFYSTLPKPAVPPPAPPVKAVPPEMAATGSHLHGGASGPEKLLAPLNLTDEEIHDVVEFLRSLTDDSIDPALKAPLVIAP